MVGVVSLDTLKMLEQQLLEVVLFVGALLFGAVILLGILFTRRLAVPMADLERGWGKSKTGRNQCACIAFRKRRFWLKIIIK